MLPTISFVNQKGGVGKTSTAIFTAAALAQAGLRVLVVDMDPQANATAGLGISPEEIVYDTADVLAAHEPGGAAAEGVILPGHSPDWDGVWIVPARLGLAKQDDVADLGSEFRLRKALESPWLDANFDVVLIDSPPSVGRLTTNALIAATHVVIVTEPTAPSLAGVVALLDSISAVTTYYNPGLEVAGVLVNRMPNTREARLRYDELLAGIEPLPIQVWETETIPLRAVITEALGAQAPPHSMPGRAGEEASAFYDAVARRILTDVVGPQQGLRLVAEGGA